MNIYVTEEPSVWVLDRVYHWNDNREIVGVSVQYHSRHDEEHYTQCEACADDHSDFMNEMALEAQMDADY